MSRVVTKLCCLLLAGMLAGCGGSDDRVEVFPVKGRITFKGKALVGGGSISFIPTGQTAGKAPGGMIHADGTYELGTYESNDGSMTGEFRVVITQTVEEEPQNTGDNGAAPVNGAVSVVAEEDRIPPVYADFSKSPLKATVDSKDLNEIDFPLEPI